MLVQNLIKKILSESPESIKIDNKIWNHNTAKNVFLIFPDKTGKLKWAVSKEKMHQDLADSINYYNISDVGYDDYRKVIAGRIWNIKGCFYVSLWNTKFQLKSILNGSLALLEIVLRYSGIKDFNKLFIEVYPDNMEDDEYIETVMVPYKDFKLDGINKNSELILKKQKMDRELHLLQPQEKNRVLKNMGIPMKVGDVPYFIKKQQRGIDESNLLKEGNIHYDQKEGIGQIPFNLMVDYRGFKCWLYPDMFLRLAKKIFIDPQDNYFLLLKNAIRKGKPIGSPYFDVTWDNVKQVWTIDGHEGRHRVQAIKELWPNEAVEVHIIPMGGIRAKDITPPMLQSFMDGVFAEDKTYVKNPTAKIEHLGKSVTPQSQQQLPFGQPPMVENIQDEQNEHFISKLEEQKAVEYIKKVIIPRIVDEKDIKSAIKNLKKFQYYRDEVTGVIHIKYRSITDNIVVDFFIRKVRGGNIIITSYGHGEEFILKNV